MTVCLPLEAASPVPQTPAFLVRPADPENQLGRVLKAILKARRIAVVCGAGISVHAGIPDFRSPEGLFQALKRDNPKESLSSGRDLFDASVFNSENTTALFCQMIAHLSELSQTATPTPFHDLLRTLDNRGRLLRVYTQNIDALESKCGLSLGVPDYEDRKIKTWSPKSPNKSKSSQHAPSSLPVDSPGVRLLSPAAETPRCIPLHGTLQRMHCQTCRQSFQLEDHLPSLSSGSLPPCPECTTTERTRELVGKRSRGVGKLRPSVVLYNEEHREGEGVGEVVRKDLIGSNKGKGRAGADLLLVVGTSLKVSGTKRIVREFAKAVRCRSSAKEKDAAGTGLMTPTSTPPRRASPADEEAPMKSVYINLDFPVPTREWEGVFDVWVKGDAQTFARMLAEEIVKEDQAKEAAAERKKKRDEEAARKVIDIEEEEAGRLRTPRKKRKLSGVAHSPSPSKKAKILPSTPTKRRHRGTVPATPSRRASSKFGKTLYTRDRAEETRPITIKIPPRPKEPGSSKSNRRPRQMMSEVCITTPVPRAKAKKKHAHLPSPSASPPLSQAKRPSRPATMGHSRSDSSDTLTSLTSLEDSDGDQDQDSSDEGMPPSFLRTLQYGLRASDG
ncbi:DHS-like NAD/FAD-binding domain-containing protein [Heliocybe sulcata]|uniref:DHS-like NAD/FAD-binding domain-containing protein n=1 Tax=Heliocybe sulcata TaxID=5364 RepID=A0A5C3MPU1_9AGAM|nr:DHS-like NAD/FAD-binding domain-containing protein [Heliocybe sulcata]